MSDDLESAVARHYGRPDLAGRILDGLKAAGADPTTSSRKTSPRSTSSTSAAGRRP
jgi:hypothetical protein